MLIRRDVLEGIRSGAIETVYRRWAGPRVKQGSKMRTAVGVLEVMSLEPVAEADLDAAEAARAGFEDVDSLLAAAGDRGPTLFKVTLRFTGPDPRIALRESIPDPQEIEEIRQRLDRLDRLSRHGPWTKETLRLIGQRPATRAEDLARSLGRDKKSFKTDVRKLKELGLTESLEIGYRLSPRGKAVVDLLG